ncbi:MAG TPA: DUF5667 domain-containing protein [Candidatus Paceibacterota bacterium]|nr:DUF5667 domain-containing protein [Candidatus Paceibacterota bacterium]
MKLTNPFHSLKQLTLDPERKARMRAELSSYADLHALPEPVAVSVASPFSALLSRTRRFYAGALAALLLVLGGTQASLAAEGALPGDVLYPIKVAVNEPLALSLSFAPERKAELAAEFAARRLEEAARLSASGRLDDKQATELASRFDEHVETLARETDALESKGALAASLAVRTDLGSRIAEGTEDFAKQEVAREDVEATATLMTEGAAAGHFASRVLEKSKTLATTREKLESALALDLEASGDVRVLAKKAKEDNEAFTATLTASVEATSTASSTKEKEEEDHPLPELPMHRFFSPFGR